MELKNHLHLCIPVMLLLVCSASDASIVDVAPRISDREIIESLTELKAGQAVINQRFEAIDKRFDEQNKTINQRFEAIDKRFDEQNRTFNQRFDVVNKRITTLSNTMLALFGAIITLIVALFAYIAWDRRTMIRPIAERLDRLENEMIRDLELRHDNGSLLTRLIKALRERARNDPKLAEILKNFSLL